MSPRSIDPVLAAVAAALTDAPRVVLAVSGGIDSMVLLDAAGRVGRDRIAAVATFDHRTGAHAARAVDHVRREAGARGLAVVAGGADRPARSEAGWRAARWAFLQHVATERGARVATAHTRDDQLETICIRVLRDAGARGLAGLKAPSRVIRPLLDLDRATIARYAAARGLVWEDDPTNLSRRFLRNRIRHDLLPAIRLVAPDFARELLALGERAAELRRAVDDLVASPEVLRLRGPAAVALAPMLREVGDAGLRFLAPAIAARAGVVLDRRGTTRLAAFILMSRPGARMQLAGGSEAVRTRDEIVVRRADPGVGFESERALERDLAGGRWHFYRVSRLGTPDAWTAALPIGAQLTVRGWRPGDRMRAAGSPAARRVKRFLRDAGITGPDRIGWPVVLADGEIVWIPGVRRSDAATERSGRPARRYRCERNDT